jgi:hypothetical protein
MDGIATIIKAAKHQDLPFIRSTFFETLNQSFNFRRRDKLSQMEWEYHSGYLNLIIDNILARCTVHIVTLEAYQTEYVGYIVQEGTVCQMVFVKAAYRHRGMGSELTQNCDCFSILTSHSKNWTLPYRPGSLLFTPNAMKERSHGLR